PYTTRFRSSRRRATGQVPDYPGDTGQPDGAVARDDDPAAVQKAVGVDLIKAGMSVRTADGDDAQVSPIQGFAGDLSRPEPEAAEKPRTIVEVAVDDADLRANARPHGVEQIVLRGIQALDRRLQHVARWRGAPERQAIYQHLQLLVPFVPIWLRVTHDPNSPRAMMAGIAIYGLISSIGGVRAEGTSRSPEDREIR